MNDESPSPRGLAARPDNPTPRRKTLMIRIISPCHLALAAAITLLAGSLHPVAFAFPRTTTGHRSQDEADDWVTVTVDGRGASVQEAMQDAITTGLRQIVGEYVTSSSTIKNDELVEDVIKSFTVGQQVKSEQVGNPKFEGATIVVTMKVSARPRELDATFEKAAASAIYMDGETLAAELAVAANNIERQKEILIELTRDLPARLLVTRMVDREGRPIDAGRIPKEDIKQLSDGGHIVALNLECYFDLESWYLKVEPRLREAMTAMALRNVPMGLRIRYDNRPGRAPTLAFVDYPVFGGACGYDWNQVDSSLRELGKVDVGESVLLLSRARDRLGSSESFDAYVIPSELDVMDIVPYEGRDDGCIALNCTLLSTSGGTLKTAQLPLNFGLAKVDGRDVPKGNIPVSGTKYLTVRPWSSKWGGESNQKVGLTLVRTGQDQRQVLLASPRFTFTDFNTTHSGPLAYSSDGYSDIGIYRFEIRLGPGELSKLGAVVFDPIMTQASKPSRTAAPRPREVEKTDPTSGPGVPGRKPSPTSDPRPGEVEKTDPASGPGVPRRKSP